MDTKLQTVEEQTQLDESKIQQIDDLVSRAYLSHLEDLQVVPFNEVATLNKGRIQYRLIKINELVFDDDEFMVDKFTTIYNSLAGDANRRVFLFVDKPARNKAANLYIGIKVQSDDAQIHIDSNVLTKTLLGQFPGSKVEQNVMENEDVSEYLKKVVDSSESISSVTTIPSQRSDTDENKRFVQGLDKLLNSVDDETYSALFIAQGADSTNVQIAKNWFEGVATSLTPFESTQLTRGTTFSETLTNSVSASKSTSEQTGETFGRTESTNSSTSESKSVSRGANMLSGLAGAGIGFLVGGPVGAVVGGVAGGVAGETVVGNHSKSTSTTTGESVSQQYSSNRSSSTSDTYSASRSEGVSNGTSTTTMLTYKNRWVTGVLDRIDNLLKRVDDFESSNLWYTAAYFMSKDVDVSTAMANTFKALMAGENTGLETSAINNWFADEDGVKDSVGEYLANIEHPTFYLNNEIVTSATMLSGNELGLFLGLPQESVVGLPVVKKVGFGIEAVGDSQNNISDSVRLGKISRLGQETETVVRLDKQSLTGHTFITGSTGAGKSTAIYSLLHNLQNDGVKFMVIEPAKGEYKHEFGNSRDVQVYGTNPRLTELLRINPFYFDSNIHVLEHVDRLTEIFSVAWTMYDAMPAMLKKAILKSYTDAGWNLKTSTSSDAEPVFPTVNDLVTNLRYVIRQSNYSEEVKGNYEGALVTRVESLTDGLNGMIFSGNQISDEELFDENVIVDLSRVGSSETKSLIMGILVLRINEYRMATAQFGNQPLRHVTVLEEAHNLLRRTQGNEQAMLAKSVEMISNAIAEMRTYGEGFIIADQSPEAVDLTAVRNTNTKIIMRLPDLADRKTVGFAAALSDSQLDELARLTRGTAVVYQNDWIEPVLVKIDYEGNDTKQQYRNDSLNQNVNDGLSGNVRWFVRSLSEIEQGEAVDIDQMVDYAQKFDLPAKVRRQISGWTDKKSADIPLVEIATVANSLLNINVMGVAIDDAQILVEEALNNQGIELAGSLTDFLTEMFAIEVAREANDVEMFVSWKEANRG